MTRLVVLSALMLSATALSAPVPTCRFVDIVSEELRTCEEGPSPDSLPYLERTDDDRYTIAEPFAEKFGTAFVFEAPHEELVDWGDPPYDEADDGDAGTDWAEWIRAFLKILVELAESQEALYQSIGFTGTYDGYVTVNGTSVPVRLDLHETGSTVLGTGMVLAPVPLNGGVCGFVDIPAMTRFPVHATTGTPQPGHAFHAAGSSVRHFEIVPILLEGDATVGFDFSLRDDYRTLNGNLTLTTPQCPTVRGTGTMSRRDPWVEYHPPPTPTCPTGERTCGGVCIDVAYDDANCGCCGHVCGTNERCTSGRCENTTF
ncbi:MAG: hypothetical protein R3F59_21205 [Myxococcota bacterium]